jgi:hypothetical protein
MSQNTCIRRDAFADPPLVTHCQNLNVDTNLRRLLLFVNLFLCSTLYFPIWLVSISLDVYYVAY